MSDRLTRAHSVRPKVETPALNMQQPQDSHPANTSIPSSLDLLALDMRKLVKRVQQLSHLGIEDNNIALPKICVVGDQSAGKSSLIEGISEIKVPRSVSTCTRCPLEINLSEGDSGESWNCTVYLSRRYWYDPEQKLATKRSKSLVPWTPIDGQDDEFFATLTDKQKLQEAIKWAQLAILNPTADAQTFVPGKNATTKPLYDVKFSPNIVRMDIKGPGFPALSFYDLPGVINVTGQDHEHYLVGLVESLIRRYVSEKNCIVLLTLPMTDDPTNSSAAKIVRDIKGAKERTLGVLTKPDRLPGSDAFDQWDDILQGKTFKLGHGYYVVRNNPDPDVDHVQAREEEETFFGQPFWSGSKAAFQPRFGTRHLQTALSAILMEQIKKCLPSIVRQINAKATRIDGELQRLPGPPRENVQRVLTQKTTILGLKLESMFEGGTGHGTANRLQAHWNPMVNDFQTALRVTRPTLLLLCEDDTSFLMPKFDSDCDVFYMATTPKKKRKDPPTEAKTSAEANSENETVPARTKKDPEYKTEVFSRWKSPGHHFVLSDIRRIKEESHRAGIPNHVDPRAIEALNRTSVKHWELLTAVFVEAVYGVVRETLMAALNEIVAEYRQTALYRKLYSIIDDFLGDLRNQYMTSALNHYCVEHETPFTMASDQHRQVKQLALEALKRNRTQARLKRYRVLRGYNDDDNTKPKVTMEELEDDPFAQEVDMMASSRAYYDIASSRFLDVICQKAHTKLFSKCRTELIKVINTKLDANSSERCIALMTEDPERQLRRAQLERERVKIGQAQEWLAAVHETKDQEEKMGELSESTVDEQMEYWAELV